MNTPVIPESAPFTAEQRAWLNGFFAGLFNIDAPSGTNGKANGTIGGLAAPPVAATEAEETMPWHDPAIDLDERLALSEGRPLSRRLMSAMAQLNCGACGYLCKTYSEAIASGAEKDLTRCSPGGSATAKALKKLVKENANGSTSGGDRNNVSATQASPNGHSSVLSNGSKIAPGYHREMPVAAKLKQTLRLTHLESPKDTRHVIIDIAGCGLKYEPGDSLGVCPVNDTALVDDILHFVDQSAGLAEVNALRHSLLYDFQISRVSEEIVEFLARFATKEVEQLSMRRMADEDAEGFLGVANLHDVFDRFPSCRPTPSALRSALRPLQPRLYSISSSQKQVGEEVHLTVGVVQFETLGKSRFGVASHFLGVRSQVNDEIRVFVQKSHFRLPQQGDTPIIMIGPGTGIAPFRAFLQERSATNASGKNWLFFGNQYSQYDFLYADELAEWSNRGVLTTLTTAFSRETSQKIYVQDRMREHGLELWNWLKEGAHFYVCGDAKKMARDVDQALREIVCLHGKMSESDAKTYLQELAVTQRYQRDVY